MEKLKVGSIVKYINEEDHRRHPSWFPPAGILGTVTVTNSEEDGEYIEVIWSDIGVHFCSLKDVENVSSYCVEILKSTNHDDWVVLKPDVPNYFIDDLRKLGYKIAVEG